MAEIERKRLFIVMPAEPADGLCLYPYTSLGYTLGNQIGIAGDSGVLVNYTAPYIFIHEYEKAQEKALELSKRNHAPYFVAHVEIRGRYIPPPPEWDPVFERAPE